MSKLYRIPGGWPPDFERSVVTIGNFDGLHRGHEQIVKRLFAAARKHKAPSVVVTFEPHPGKVLGPDARPMIYPYAERVRLLFQQGVDAVVVQEFTAAVSKVEARDWARDVLVDGLRARHVVIGYDFHFGHEAQGDASFLAKMGAENGFDVEQVRATVSHGQPVSSSRVRRLLDAGEVAMAADLLGHPFYLRGRVGRGDGRGRHLGFPTANLETDWELRPARGVYACLAVVNGERRAAAVNVGINPTFEGSEPTIEAHLLDFDEDLYGRDVTIHFLRRLRDERKFDGIEELVRHIRKDLTRVRQIVARRFDIEVRS
ncbi:MAG: bifunctional riboflavin kinase/FAD synthetase [Deltaproteobacteria bacterium]|nr:bifunctional riboflavin kinase/FAD synthetase [Deltaproteobacteria bacterium]